MKKVIKIFLASSITEFEAERNDLEVFIRNMSDIYEDQYDIKIKPVRCEQVDPYITDSRTQDIINESLKECEMCVILVYTRFGEFSYEEFRYALQRFRESAEHLPKIYVYFKHLEEGVTADDSVKKFMSELNDSLKHYYGTFKNIDTVKLRIALNFVAQKLDISSVTMDEGKIVLNGVRMDGLDVQKVSEFSNSEELQDLYARLREIESEYYELHAKYKKGEIASDSPLFEKYSKLATKRIGIKTQIEELENTIFDFSVRLSKDEVGGNISERQKAAYRLFESGDLEGANEVLDEEEIESDYRARKAKILARKMEELRLNAIVYINEIKTKIDILKMLRDPWKQREKIESLYEKVLPEAEEMGVRLEVFYDYASYLFENCGYENREERLRKALDLVLQLSGLYEENEKEDSFEKQGFLALLTGKIYLAIVGDNVGSAYIKEGLACLHSADETFAVLALRNPEKYNQPLTETSQNLGKIYELKRDFVTAEKYYVKPVKFYLQSGKLRNAKHKKALADNYAKMNTATCFDKAIELYEELYEQDEFVYGDALRECYENYAKYCKAHKNIPFGTEACPFNIFDYVEYKRKQREGTAEPHVFDVYEAMERNAVAYIEKAIEIAQKQALTDPKKYYEIISDDYEWLCGYHLSSLQEPKAKEPRLNAAAYLEKCIALSDEKECVEKGYYEKIVKLYDGLSSFTRFNLSQKTGIAIVEDEAERNKYAAISAEWKKRELFARAEMEKETLNAKDHTFSNECFDFAQKNLKEEEIRSFLQKTVLSIWEKLFENSQENALRLLQEYFRVAECFPKTLFGEEYFQKGVELAYQMNTEESKNAIFDTSLMLFDAFLDADLKKAEEYLVSALPLAKGEQREKNRFVSIGKIKRKYEYEDLDEDVERWLLASLQYATLDYQKPLALQDLASFYQKKGRYGEAVKYYEEYLSFGESAYVYETIFECYQKLGDNEKAEKYGSLCLKTAEAEVKDRVGRGERNPWCTSWENACGKLAEIYVRNGEWERAKTLLTSVSDYFDALVESGKPEYQKTLGESRKTLCDRYIKYEKYADCADLAWRWIGETLFLQIDLQGSEDFFEKSRREEAAYQECSAYVYLLKSYGALNDVRFEEKLTDFLKVAEPLKNSYFDLSEIEKYLKEKGYPNALLETELYALLLNKVERACPEADEYYDRLCALTKKHGNDFPAELYFACARAVINYSPFEVGIDNEKEREKELLLCAVSFYERAAACGKQEYLDALHFAYEKVASTYPNEEREAWFLYKYEKIIEFLERMERNEALDELLRKKYYDAFKLRYNWKKYESAADYCLKMETLLKKYQDKDLYQRKLAEVYNDWAVVCLELALYDKHRQYLLQAEEMLERQFGKDGEIRAKSTLSTVCFNLAWSYRRTEEFEEAKRRYLQTVDYSKQSEKCGKLGENLLERKRYYERAIGLFSEQKFQELQEFSKEYFGLCLRLYQEFKEISIEEYFRCIDLIIHAFFEAQELALAKEYGDCKVKTAEEILQKEGRNAIVHLKNALQTASETFRKAGDEEGAKGYEKRLEELSL